MIFFSLCLCLVTCQTTVTNTYLSMNVTETFTESSTTFTPEDSRDVKDDSVDQKSFFDKLRELHRKNGNKSVVYRVEHINQTFEAIDNLQNNMKYLFKFDDKLGIQLMSFLLSLKIQLSTTCSSAILQIYSAVKKSDIWAMKCTLTYYYLVM